jgi:conjugal transfer/entry exclusion protein
LNEVIAKRDEVIKERDRSIVELRSENNRMMEQLRHETESKNRLMSELAENQNKPKSQSDDSSRARQVLVTEALQRVEVSRREASEWQRRFEGIEAERRVDDKKHRRSKANDKLMVDEVEESRNRIVTLEKALIDCQRHVDKEETEKQNLQKQVCDLNIELARYSRYKESLEDRIADLLQDHTNTKDLLQENLELREAVRTAQNRTKTLMEQTTTEMANKVTQMQQAMSQHNSNKTALR